MLHAADMVAHLARQALRVLEHREEGIVAHVEEVVAQVVVGRLPAVLLVRHAPHVNQAKAHHARVEVHRRRHVVRDDREVIYASDIHFFSTSTSAAGLSPAMSWPASTSATCSREFASFILGTVPAAYMSERVPRTERIGQRTSPRSCHMSTPSFGRSPPASTCLNWSRKWASLFTTKPPFSLRR